MGIVATIGFFDGVHRGHQWLIQQVLHEAQCRDARSLIITFDRHPRTVFAPGTAPACLTTAEEKMRLLQASGVDDIYVLPFDKAMASLTAREFMLRVLHEQLHVTALVVGYDHRFGRPVPAEGDVPPLELYRRYGHEAGIEVVEATPLEGGHVSSSAIRRALMDGDVDTASQLLGRPYTWTGTVVHGHALGRQLGFPTANLEAVEPRQALPANGSYAVRLGERAAMLNIGVRPTVDNSRQCSVEAHVLDYDGNLYGTRQTITFVQRLRSERAFRSRAALVSQLRRDEAQTRQALCGKPTWWQRLRESPLTYLLLFFITQAAGGAVGGLAMLLLPMLPPGLGSAVAARCNVMVIALLTANVAAIAAFAVCHPRRTTWRHLVGGFSARRIGGMVWMLLFAMLAIPCVNILQELLLPALPAVVDEATFSALMHDGAGLAVVCVLGPVAEELLFRGGVQMCLRRYPIVASAALFALVHLNPPQMPAAFVLGLLLAWAHAETASLAAPVCIHVLNNTSATVLTLCCPETDSLVELLGGSTMAWVVAVSCAAAMAALWLLWRRRPAARGV